MRKIGVDHNMQGHNNMLPEVPEPQEGIVAQWGRVLCVTAIAISR